MTTSDQIADHFGDTISPNRASPEEISADQRLLTTLLLQSNG